MNAKTLLGCVVTGLALFVLGFLYWGINPLPYSSWNLVDDPAAAQTSAGALFPEDGVYFLPGPGSDPEAMKLLETGPSVLLTIEHEHGGQVTQFVSGFVHNILSAVLMLDGQEDGRSSLQELHGFRIAARTR